MPGGEERIEEETMFAPYILQIEDDNKSGG